jgi:hypothetical protein
MIDTATDVQEMNAFPRYVAVGQLAQGAQLRGLGARTKPPEMRAIEPVAEKPEDLVRLPPGTRDVREVPGQRVLRRVPVSVRSERMAKSRECGGWPASSRRIRPTRTSWDMRSRVLRKRCERSP